MKGDELSFEEAYQKLEEVVRALEEGGKSLEETVALFEEGIRLSRLCNARLDAAELRVSQLVPLEEEPFASQENSQKG